MKVVIIGGSGGMGKLFTRFFEKQGLSVESIGRSTENYKELVESSDVVIISVPIDAVKETIDKISAFNISGKLVINLASNMLEGTKDLEALECDTCCLHALFGPDITNFENQNLVIAPTRENRKLEEIIDLLKKENAKIVRTSPEKHDEIMAYVQALSQFSSISLAKTIAEGGNTPETLESCSSVSFRLNVSLIERIMSQPAELWANIQFFNKKFPDILETHINNSIELKDIVLRRDFEAFKEKFDSVKDYWATQSTGDYGETTEQLKKIRKEDSIAVLGPRGTFSQQAARVYNGKLVPVFFDSIEEVIAAVSEGRLNVGVVPLENSIHGTIVQTIDGTYRTKIKIIEEIAIPIEHVVAGVDNLFPKAEVTKIYSHPQALGQCKGYLQENFPSARLLQTPSTAFAFEKVQKEGSLDSLAVGPRLAAEIYGLKLFGENIQERNNNKTSFVIIQKEEGKTGGSKTTLVVDPKIDRPGLLHDLLSIFKKRDINLSKIESRPSKEKLGTYIFYFSIDIGRTPLLGEVIEDLGGMGSEVYSLGSYDQKIIENEN